MTLRGPLFFSFLLGVFLLAAFYPKAVNDTEKETMLMRAILTFVDRMHYDAKAVDDEFSEELYDLYLEGIDGSRRFLTQEEVAKL